MLNPGRATPVLAQTGEEHVWEVTESQTDPGTVFTQFSEAFPFLQSYLSLQKAKGLSQQGSLEKPEYKPKI